MAPASYYMPIEVVSVRVREHQHQERTPFEDVSWTAAGIVRQNERMKEFEGGRRPTKGRSGTVEERQGCTDEQTKYPGIVANDENGALDQVTSRGKNDYSV